MPVQRTYAQNNHFFAFTFSPNPRSAHMESCTQANLRTCAQTQMHTFKLVRVGACELGQISLAQGHNLATNTFNRRLREWTPLSNTPHAWKSQP